MLSFTQESFGLDVDKKNLTLKQGDLVDNTANFCHDCVILSLTPKVDMYFSFELFFLMLIS